jgi:DNA invertase Pin-like site-specific DNA recombinase
MARRKGAGLTLVQGGGRRLVGYVRVSTAAQVEQGHSLEAQRAKLQLWCELHGHTLVAVLADEGRSASTLDGRPGAAEALRLCRTGAVDGVLVSKLDRLTRSTRDLAELLDDSCRHGWALVSVAEQLDTATAAGRLVVGVLGAVAQWEREAIGERTSAAMAHMRAVGRYTGGACRYGWQVGTDGQLVPHAGERAVLAAVRELRASGLSLRAVAAELHARGLLSRGGRAWSASGVQRLEAEAAEVAA